MKRVTVHNRRTFPSVAEHGLDIQPNTETNIAIERVSLILSRRMCSIKTGDHKKRGCTLWQLYKEMGGDWNG